MTTDGAREQAAGPGRIALRTPLEAFLWVFITRLIGLLTATRAPAAGPDTPDEVPSAAAPAADPDRARRVAASRGGDGAGPDDGDARHAAHDAHDARTTLPGATRAVVVTAGAAAVAGAAAFAAGRRRGRR